MNPVHLPASKRGDPKSYGAAWRRTRAVLGGLLLMAATMKTHELVADRLVQAPMLSGRAQIAAVAGCEAVWGLWLLLGPAWRGAWTLTTLLWLSFLAFALHDVVTRARSCGCFGHVAIHPLYVALLDAAAVGALFYSRSS